MPQRPTARTDRAARAARASGVTAALAAALVTATVSAAPAGAAVTTEQPRLRVLSHNSFLFSKSLYPNWGQDHRAREIPRAEWFSGHDVVVLQEAFDNSASEALLGHAADRYPHRTGVLGRSRSGWDATHGSYSALAPEDGGVAVLSKWPIVRKEQFVYKDGCGSDWLSNKGFVYAVLEVRGSRVHVVGTHAQSTDPGCADGQAARVRGAQFRQLDVFLDAKGIPAHEQVIVAGDLNVDSYSGEYDSMLADAGLVDADSRTGRSHSFDTRDNSVAAERYPDDPRENLDHVLHRAGHARPSDWNNHVVDERSAPWAVTSWGTSHTYRNLSDHYPVVGG